MNSPYDIELGHAMHPYIPIGHQYNEEKKESPSPSTFPRNKTTQDKFAKILLPIDETCPFANVSFDHLPRESINTNKHLAYVVAILWDQNDKEYFADATKLQEKMHALQNSQNQILTIPNTTTQVKKIEYFVTKSPTTPFKWIKLEEVTVAKKIMPSSFIDAYIYCCSHGILEENILTKRHAVIRYLYNNHDSLAELYYWLQLTADDFPDDRWTYDLLEKVFATYPRTDFKNKSDLQQRISYLKCQDIQRVFFLSMQNIVKLSAGAVIAHFTSPAARLGIFGGYWIGRALIWNCLLPSHPIYKSAEWINNIFLGLFAGEGVEGVRKAIISPIAPTVNENLEVLATLLGIVSVTADTINSICSRSRSRFENITRCWNVCSRRLYIS